MDSMVENMMDSIAGVDVLMENSDCVKHIILLAEYFRDNPKVMAVKDATGEHAKNKRMTLHAWYQMGDTKDWFAPHALAEKYDLTPVVWANILHELSSTGLVHIDVDGMTNNKENMQSLFSEVFTKRHESRDMNTPLESNGKVSLRAIGVLRNKGSKAPLIQGDIDFVLDPTTAMVEGEHAEAEAITEGD